MTINGQCFPGAFVHMYLSARYWSQIMLESGEPIISYLYFT